PRSSPLVSSSTLPSSRRIDTETRSSTKISANDPPRARAARSTSDERARSGTGGDATNPPGSVRPTFGGHPLIRSRLRSDAFVLGALATSLLLWFLGLFLLRGFRFPVGPDAPVCLWWTRLAGAEGLSTV